MRKIFVYAAEKQAWQEYPAGAEEQIAKFPVNCIFPEEPHYNSSWRHRKNRCNTALLCWCDKHKKNEQLIMTDNGINSAKCHALKGAAAFFKKEIPIHWEMMPEDIDPKNYTFEPSKKNKPTIISAAKEAWKNFEKELFPTPIEYRGFNRHGIAAYAWMLEQQGATELIVTAELIDIRRNIYCTSRNTIMGQSRLQPTRRALRVIYDMRTGGKRYEEEIIHDKKRWWQQTEGPGSYFIPTDNTLWEENQLALPKELVITAMQLAAFQSSSVFGFIPSIPKEAAVPYTLEDFVSRPLDMNIRRLQQFIGSNYEKLFPRTETNCFGVLCAYLKIPSSKSLRKAYLKNPMSLILYKLLNLFGFKDINVIRELLKEDFPLPIDLDNFVYDRLDDRLVLKSRKGHHADFSEELRLSRMYVKLLLDTKSEAGAAKLILKTSKDSIINDRRMIIDSLMMIQHYWNRFPEDVRRKIFHDGITMGTHDRMGKAAAKLEYGHHEIHYDRDPYSCNIKGYNFRLVHNTMDLHDIGMLLENCVGTYAGAVVNGNTKIVSVDKNGIYCACIELYRDKYVYQAKAMHNRQPQGELAFVILKWIMTRKLSLQTQDLPESTSIRHIVLQGDYPETEVEPKIIYALCSLKDLLYKIEKNMPRHFYSKLLLELDRDETLKRYDEPTNQQFKDETQRFIFLFPYGRALLKEGAAGNALAQDVLGYLYNCDKFFPRHRGWSIFWYNKAAENGEVTAMLHLAELYLELENNLLAKQWGFKAAKQGYRPAIKWCKQNISKFLGCA